MGLPIPAPELQFCDANGLPYAGGTVETYVPGTTTPKDTYQDEASGVLNTNPIVLDAAGRAIVWGAGDYRFVVRDSAGQLVYDQVTSVVDTSTFATTADITAAVQTETNRAEAAEATLTTNLNAEVTRAEAAENTLTTDLNNEIARAEAAEAHLQSEISAGTAQNIQYGYASSDSTGHASVTFATAYTSSPVVVACCAGVTLGDEWVQVSPTTTGASFYVSQPLAGSTLGPAAMGIFWIAIGT